MDATLNPFNDDDGHAGAADVVRHHRLEPRLAVIGFVPQEFGCCLSRRQQSRRQRASLHEAIGPREKLADWHRRACRLDMVVKQITGSDNTLTVSYCTKWAYQSADIATTICGPGHSSRRISPMGGSRVRIGAHNCFSPSACQAATSLSTARDGSLHLTRPTARLQSSPCRA